MPPPMHADAPRTAGGPRTGAPEGGRAESAPAWRRLGSEETRTRPHSGASARGEPHAPSGAGAPGKAPEASGRASDAGRPKTPPAPPRPTRADTRTRSIPTCGRFTQRGPSAALAETYGAAPDGPATLLAPGERTPGARVLAVLAETPVVTAAAWGAAGGRRRIVPADVDDVRPWTGRAGERAWAWGLRLAKETTADELLRICTPMDIARWLGRRSQWQRLHALAERLGDEKAQNALTRDTWTEWKSRQCPEGHFTRPDTRWTG